MYGDLLMRVKQAADAEEFPQRPRLERTPAGPMRRIAVRYFRDVADAGVAHQVLLERRQKPLPR
jgi:hypothetical protein